MTKDRELMMMLLRHLVLRFGFAALIGGLADVAQEWKDDTSNSVLQDAGVQANLAADIKSLREML